ncbi:ABC transporter permease [bacterium]|nr:ABC transporter permease [bacterium]
MRFLIQFFLKNGIHSRRTLWMGLICLIPLAVAVLLFLFRPILSKEGIELPELFPQINFWLYLHFLLPLVSVFIGSAVIGDEVEDRTLPYLLTRPLERRWIVLSKLVAGWMTAGVLMFSSLLLTYVVMMLGGGVENVSASFGQLLQSGGVLLIGLAVYIPLFTLLGGVVRRPVLAGLILTFGWENSVAFFPGNVKLVTVAHYLHILSPPLQKVDQGGARNLFNMVIQTTELSTLTAVLILVGLGAIFIWMSSSLLLIKEYRLQQEA